MNTPLELTQDYLSTQVLREATEKIYLAATRALLRHFGETVTLEAIDQRSVLGWRKKVLEGGLAKQSWNTYSNHMRTVWGHALEHGTLTHTTINPFKKTSVIPPKRPKKTVPRDSIKCARDWLMDLVVEERITKKRSTITPAWFWLAVFELFYQSGIRLNALLSVRYKDVKWDNRLLLVDADTEKTHREYSIPITGDLEPHIRAVMDAAEQVGFEADDQLFNVNRFSQHYRRKTMNTDQVEAMYRKLINRFGTKMTPHRFRHTLATDLMRQPERNIHITKSLLNHSNVATTLGYIETDYDHMRAVMQERSMGQGATRIERRVDDRIPVSVPEEEIIAVELPEAESPPLLIAHEPEPCESPVLPPTQTLSETSGYKLLTHVESLDSDRYTIDQAMLPTGTGLSHELSWDGPGTWWEDLALPSPSNEESMESSMMFTLMSGMTGMKSYSRG